MLNLSRGHVDSLRALGFVRADWDGEELTVFDDTDEPFSRFEFERGSKARAMLELVEFDLRDVSEEPGSIDLRT